MDFDISPVQLRMARAALKLSSRDLAEKIGVSHTMINRAENGDDRISVETLRKLYNFYSLHGARFASHDSISFNSKPEIEDCKWLMGAFCQILIEKNLMPSSTELIAAAKRHEELLKACRENQ